jgi:hypothetical protein
MFTVFDFNNHHPLANTIGYGSSLLTSAHHHAHVHRQKKSSAFEIVRLKPPILLLLASANGFRGQEARSHRCGPDGQKFSTISE